MSRFLLLTTGLTILLSACSQQTPPSATQQPYEIVADNHQLMLWILDPAADVIWGSAGTIITSAGRQELAPTTDEGWDKVVHAGAVVAESGNLLLMPGRAAGDDWIEYAQGLVAAGKLAIKAGQDKDADAVFEAGGKIYLVCRACHSQYMINARE